MIVNLSNQHSLVTNWISELRNVEVQNDRMRFRKNLERLGEVMAYEISKEMPWVQSDIQTPLGIHTGKLLSQQPVLATILRAGMPLHNGMLAFFDKADNAFISAYRKHHRDGTFEIRLEYISCPSVEDRIVILSDTMLATGSSIAAAIEALKNEGAPKEIYVVTAIACTVGVDFLVSEYGENIKIWCGDIDDELTAKGYIVPGLGDAGDLSYGVKVQL